MGAGEEGVPLATGDLRSELGLSKLRHIMKNLANLQVQLAEECDREVGLLLRERDQLVEQSKTVRAPQSHFSPQHTRFSQSFSNSDVHSEAGISPPSGRTGLPLPVTADRHEYAATVPGTPRLGHTPRSSPRGDQLGEATSETARLEGLLHQALQDVLQVRHPLHQPPSPDKPAAQAPETPRRPHISTQKTPPSEFAAQSEGASAAHSQWSQRPAAERLQTPQSAYTSEQETSERVHFRETSNAAVTHDDWDLPLPPQPEEEDAVDVPKTTSSYQSYTKKSREGGPGSGVLDWIHTQLSVPPTFEERGIARTQLEHFVESVVFSLVSGLAVIANAVYIGIYADFTLQNERKRLEGQAFADSWWVVTQLFDFFFLVEILIRMCAERQRFLWGKNMSWNVFDALIVVISLSSTAMDGDMATVPQVSYLRILRLARVLHTVRFFRLPVFSHLRMVSNAVIQTVPVASWSAIVLLLCLYMSGVAFTLGIARKMQSMDSLVSESGAVNAQATSDLRKVTTYFPSLIDGMKHLFMGITGGIDWESIYVSLEPLDGWYQFGYLVYTLFLLFAVINVISGMVIERAFKVVKQDRDFWIMEAQHQNAQYEERVRGLFHQIDLDASGTVTWDEFSNAMNNPHVEAYLSFIEVDTVDLFDVFMLLDKDGNQKIEIDEFVDGVHELRGIVHKAQVKQIHNLLTTVLGVVGEIYDTQLKGKPTVAAQEKGKHLVSQVSAVASASARKATRKSMSYTAGRISATVDDLGAVRRSQTSRSDMSGAISYVSGLTSRRSRSELS